MTDTTLPNKPFRKLMASNVKGEHTPSIGAHEGVVRKWMTDKGYGFIDCHDGESRFVHISKVVSDKPLNEGDIVLYDTIKTQKGEQCSNVSVKVDL